jgi:F0F1-type ATP synthase assembly protein I
MAQETPGQAPGDPWAAFGLLVAGVGFYGMVGWLLDRWWGTSYVVVIGILLGAALGTWATWARFKAPPDSTTAAAPKHQ